MKKIIAKIRESKTAFWSGVALLIINPPLGWIAFVIGGYFSAKYHSTKYMVIATIIYALTWVMAGIGVILAGPKGVALAKNFFRKIWSKNFRKNRNLDVPHEKKNDEAISM